MDPLRLKCWNKKKRIPLECEIKSDVFSFGISILEMGNLLKLKNIKLNEDKVLLKQQI